MKSLREASRKLLGKWLIAVPLTAGQLFLWFAFETEGYCEYDFKNTLSSFPRL